MKLQDRTSKLIDLIPLFGLATRISRLTQLGESDPKYKNHPLSWKEYLLYGYNCTAITYYLFGYLINKPFS